MKRSAATRSIGRGLAKIDDLASDTLVAYAARAGSFAEDGVRDHSPYTTAIVKYLALPGLDLRLALGRVRDEVLKSVENTAAFLARYCQTDMRLDENILSKEEYRLALAGKRHFRDAVLHADRP